MTEATSELLIKLLFRQFAGNRFPVNTLVLTAENPQFHGLAHFLGKPTNCMAQLEILWAAQNCGA